MESESIEQLKKELKADQYSFEIIRKNIKHVYFRVYPDKSRVVVSAPTGLESRSLENVIAIKKNWILRRIRKAENNPKPDTRQLLSAKGLFFNGRYYQLDVTPVFSKTLPIRVDHSSRVIYLPYPPGPNQERKSQKRLTAWLRDQFKGQLSELVKKWEPIVGVHVHEFRVRRMKTRWGSCNIRDRRIWLNFALIHYRPEIVAYVTVHEMVHLLERKHNKRFDRFMDRFVPDWRDLKAELNGGLIA